MDLFQCHGSWNEPVTLQEHLVQAKARFEQAKANANFYAGQVALLESLLAEELPDSVNTKPNGAGDNPSEPRS